jgi:hypothetical protein
MTPSLFFENRFFLLHAIRAIKQTKRRNGNLNSFKIGWVYVLQFMLFEGNLNTSVKSEKAEEFSNLPCEKTNFV